MMPTKKCHNCNYEWATRIDEPKACPRCKTRLKTAHSRLCLRCRSELGLVESAPEPVVVPEQQTVENPLPYSVQMDMERDILKLMAVPDEEMGEAIVALQASYDDPDIVHQIITKALEKKSVAMAEEKSDLAKSPEQNRKQE